MTKKKYCLNINESQTYDIKIYFLLRKQKHLRPKIKFRQRNILEKFSCALQFSFQFCLRLSSFYIKPYYLSSPRNNLMTSFFSPKLMSFVFNVSEVNIWLCYLTRNFFIYYSLSNSHYEKTFYVKLKFKCVHYIIQWNHFGIS